MLGLGFIVSGLRLYSIRVEGLGYIVYTISSPLEKDSCVCRVTFLLPGAGREVSSGIGFRLQLFGILASRFGGLWFRGLQRSVGHSGVGTCES